MAFFWSWLVPKWYQHGPIMSQNGTKRGPIGSILGQKWGIGSCWRPLGSKKWFAPNSLILLGSFLGTLWSSCSLLLLKKCVFWVFFRGLCSGWVFWVSLGGLRQGPICDPHTHMQSKRGLDEWHFGPKNLHFGVTLGGLLESFWHLWATFGGKRGSKKRHKNRLWKKGVQNVITTSEPGILGSRSPR